ncbi:WD domain-containing protein [Cucurbitaria berberidis CBS 394.84]|uniref:WD domain-containing protein n=1 Tax=Cucurbitaria berberidis CBS 394.84 TaxID=1168544 RepID=A0A9P4L516_9PLEO|nr:WD domain-containing protein [Cucurbitaria berberidis CBS 394.84]KAF1841882.1 WD domain-containing protein [Cucurbitaria berberidis CBS 394.84]
MSPVLQHECTRIPVTALASCGVLLIVAEGPFVRFYHAKDSRYISSKRIFKAQVVHGISVYSGEHDHVTKLVIWGGRLVRALDIEFTTPDHQPHVLTTCLSDVGKSPDWILDLAVRPTSQGDESEGQRGICIAGAVTAHNALLQVSIERQDVGKSFNSSSFTTTISELTSSSRSILYSAHLFWESSDRVLVAAGTAFGEIMYWSWSHDSQFGPVSRIHRVFLGHEGSIFGVQISKELPSECCKQLKRVIASCSDDRTIRIWDVSDVNTISAIPDGSDDDVLRTRHTGFSNESFDANTFASSDCLAIGWGHMSRVWTVRFLDSPLCNESVFLQSAGEDATSRTWELVPNDEDNKSFSYKLLHLDCAAYHSGKNLWSTSVCYDSAGPQQVDCGAADSKITSYALPRMSQKTKTAAENIPTEYTLHDVLSLSQPAVENSTNVAIQEGHGSSKKADFFRGYCFVDEHTTLLTTNSGKVLLGSVASEAAFGQSGVLTDVTFVAQLEDLSGYSVCVSALRHGMAFVAGAKGSIYAYCQSTHALTKVHSVNGKVGELHTTSFSTSTGREVVASLVTLVGQKEAQLLYVDIAPEVHVFYVVVVPISDALTGSLVTSMAHVRTSIGHFLFLGFRRGAIAAYRLGEDDSGTQATLLRIIENAHGSEAVTSLAWKASSADSTFGHALSVGRDGRLAVHHIDLSTNLILLIHNPALPIGPNIEGLYFHQSRLFVHGFSSKKWVLYDVTAEEEVMGVETGGAHRSWAFQPRSSSQGGTLVWTRAAGMHIYSQTGPNHTVIRSGGHGREIKAVAVSPVTNRGCPNRGCPNRFIATGSEDTDIKIFQYIEGELVCRKTIRKHTTGIQHLQWSDDGDYLFSSGGCEEFYIWRIRELPSFLDVGIVCEHVYAPESEHSDLRIMSFDIRRRESGHTIAMVFSDSSIKVYDYTPEGVVKWQPIARGTYFTSCLTQCTFLSPQRILTIGTDGHAVVWPLSPDMNQSTVDSSYSVSTLIWQHPARIHQNSSKAMVSHALNKDMNLIASGGDDGSLAFLLTRTALAHSSAAPATSYASPPVLIQRAHASAITACAVTSHQSRIFIITSGNDEWVRLWEVTVQNIDGRPNSKEATSIEDWIVVKRHKKIKTHVADVSSMAIVDSGGGVLDARVLLCGVGMEVIRVEWEAA